MRTLIWYRNDLRLHDHEPLYRALQQEGQIIPLYCFDPRQWGQTAFGFAKTGSHRTQFLLESLADLRQSWQALGGDLILRQGLPEAVIPELVQQLEIDAVYWHEEITAEERAVAEILTAKLESLGVRVRSFWGATLYRPDNLPFALSQVPEVFTQFRKRVEQDSAVDPLFPVPKQVSLVEGVPPGELPTLESLGLATPTPDERAVLQFVGGETTALKRLHHYLWGTDCLKRYKETRNGLLGADYSSKFSPWLALGCLSPRKIYEEVQHYEANRFKNDSTYWLVFELLWRDYFRFICAKHGNKVFYPSGLRGLSIEWKQDWERFELWRQGKTGFPFIDANMQELAATGFMSNRGRQNVASFLTKKLGIDWRMGAEWFESCLIDHDVCSNYGNWNYTAGVGNDARGFRYFNIPKQAKDYDPQGAYVKHWLPQLAQIPAKQVHAPWRLQAVEQTRFGVRIGVDYPAPIVDLEKSVRANEEIYNRALNRPPASQRRERWR
ncbi:DASH family cryptochrome [Pseudanabaena sp. FACHB-2040]|uniref:DASH family cryptochrome n=1 Tax=Pseudanabaena sp. FACHB-2040 TaxID=2692859 RepID=UPI00168A3CDA|nr:DASH family cryptochrome [Pseudanabaena sp. FACHB-2040]MBD2256708.1 DASH family cryptochrome [Pseudanabaena sp. FACHB-2040]